MSVPFSGYSQRQWINLFEFFLTATLICLLISLIFSAILHQWNNDFIDFWLGGYSLRQGIDPYLHYLSVGNISADEDTFVNLPWVGVFFIPFTYFEFNHAVILWIITNALFFIGCLILTDKILKFRLPRWAIRLIQLGMLFLVVRAFQASQITIILTFLGLVGLYELLKQKERSAGFWIGLTIWKPFVSVGFALAAIYAFDAQKRNKLLFSSILTALLVVIGVTIFWPNWLSNYSRVDFRQAMGILKDGEFLYYWPVATLNDFSRFILGIPSTKITSIFFTIAPFIYGSAILLYVVYLFRKEVLELIELCAIGALLPALISPYIRYYDYIFLSLWLIGMIGGANFHRMGMKPKIITSSLIILTFLLLPGSRPEPWVYIMPVSFSLISVFILYTGSINFSKSVKVPESNL